MQPKRIQRSRKHKNLVKAVYVGRPSAMGNPFVVSKEGYSQIEAVQKFEAMLAGDFTDPDVLCGARKYAAQLDLDVEAVLVPGDTCCFMTRCNT